MEVAENVLGSKFGARVGLMQIIDVRNQLVTGKGRYKTRPLSQIKQIVIHHSATKTGSAEAYARWHVQKHDWPGIGYHYVVEQDGTAKKTNSLSSISYHCGRSNRISVGICFTGEYNVFQLPFQMLDAGAELCAEIIKALPRLALNNIIRHQDCPGYRNKFCPGKLFPMDELRSLVTNRLR